MNTTHIAQSSGNRCLMSHVVVSRGAPPFETIFYGMTSYEVTSMGYDSVGKPPVG